MANIKNISDGPRGAYIGDTLVMIEAGASAEGDFTDVNSEWFEGGDAASEPGPLDQSVEKLTKYLEGVENADDVQALIDAEMAGKSRAGAITALESRRDALLAA